MLLVFQNGSYLHAAAVSEFLPKLDTLSRRITSFSRRLPKS